jgi:hypothetical protein
VQDHVLGEKARGQREARDGQTADTERQVRDRHEFLHAPELVQVRVAVRVHGVHHTAGAEEQTGLEECVREHVEDARAEGAHAHRREHETELTDRGVGQHLLELVLHQRDASREQRREGAGDRDHGHRRR